ncbi:MAG TPA: hypothetical protein VGC60_20110 [Pyrinomonadaceae bacterium]|jgi:hypothetical protein
MSIESVIATLSPANAGLPNEIVIDLGLTPQGFMFAPAIAGLNTL